MGLYYILAGYQNKNRFVNAGDVGIVFMLAPIFDVSGTTNLLPLCAKSAWRSFAKIVGCLAILTERTLELAGAARSSVLALLQFVNIEEIKKEKAREGIMPRRPAP
jgi:predicted TIM-barrel enzyme